MRTLLPVICCYLFTAYSVLAAGSKMEAHCQVLNGLPTHVCTPGAVLTTDVKKICQADYVKTIPVISQEVQKRIFAQYGIPYSKHSNYELDHLISLELGGSNDISNVWPESLSGKNSARDKNRLENYLHREVCTHKIDLATAQQEMLSDWVKYYASIFEKPTQKTTKHTNHHRSL